MNVKAVVKVMNFHSLLRVDSSRKRAEHYASMERELASMMRIVLNNRNLKLDKLIKLPDPDLPVLRIYIGSDYGFCGNVNTAVSSFLNADGGEKVAIGKKLKTYGNVALYLHQEDFAREFEQIRKYLERAVTERCWSSVELIYNRYYNAGLIKPERTKIFPLDLGNANEEDLQAYEADFMIEGEPERILRNMMITYLMFEVKIAEASAYASENLMRQNATSESLKKIEEMEEEDLKEARREKNQRSFQKTIDSYIKQKAIKRIG